MKPNNEYTLYQMLEKYGGKRAWLRAHASRLMDSLGFLPPGPPKFKFAEFRRLVFVCQGNICRSPYGEARACQLGILSASFGLNADTGREANLSATRIAKQRGLTLDSHRAKHLSKFSFETGDLVLTFEPQQLAQLTSSGVLPDGVVADLLGRWCSPTFPYLHDPYGLSDTYFTACFDRIDQALTHLIPFIPSAFLPR
ncbi:protein-tyrosine phosphatase [Nitrosospira multiformis]|uniref:protein-tyrosine-phosphatase n=1 Tax=Nitrosospira multiformis TaxID=1231 RepID=A0A1H8C2H7_9PROT|nr:hypothetical protein [Nitrosospira multiformis]SEM88654.1 protein-tyrosine phosphatase [Nitrosospira multiformis]